MQLVKPYSADGDRMHLCLSVARDDSFTNVVIDGFDTANGENYKYVKAFVPVSDSESMWQQMPSNGFYADADDVPLMLCFLDVLNAAGEVPTVKSTYFLKYFWYSEPDGVQHKSDEFSIAVPSNTACGAIPADSVHKSEFYDLQQLVQPVAHAVELCAYDDTLEFYEC